MSLFGSGRREGLLAVLTLLLLSIALHAPGLFLGMPRGPSADRMALEPYFEADTNQETLLPALRSAGDAVASGELPLWNPSARLGEPFLTSGAPVFYPPFWMLMFGGGAGILDLVMCLHTFLACMFMFRFCRVLPMSRYVSFLSGALYGLGWYFTAQLDRLPDAAAAAWVPLALEFTWRVLVSDRRASYGGWLAVVLGMLFVTGGTGIAWLGVVLCLAMFLNGLPALDRENQGRALQAAGVCVVLSAMVTAPNWVHHLAHAPRFEPAAGPATPHLQPAGLLGTLTPNAFGGLSNSAAENLKLVNPDADPLELTLFPGTVILFLGLLGLLRPKRTSIGLFWILVGGVGLTLSLDTPIAVWFFATVGWFDGPGHALLLVNLAFVVLAAKSLERFFEAPMARPFAVPVTAVIALTLAATALVCGFVLPGAGESIVRLFLQGTAGEITASMRHMRIALLPTVLFTAAIAGLFLTWRRIGMMRFKLILEILVLADLLTVALAYTPRMDREIGESHLTARLPEAAGRAVLVGRNTSIRSQPLRDAGAPTLTTTSPAILSRTADLLRAIDASAVLVGHRARVLPLQTSRLIQKDLLDVAGVGIVITRRPGHFDGFTLMSPAPAAEHHTVEAGHLHLSDLPPRRVRMCFHTIRADSRDEARSAVVEHIGELRDAVVLEGADPDFQCAAPGEPAEVEIVHAAYNTVRVRVDVHDGAGYLVLADAFAPGWQAFLNGEPVTIHPANVALRAVEIPRGAHVVEFRYRPWLARIGIPLAVFGMLLLVGWLWLTRHRPRLCVE